MSENRSSLAFTTRSLLLLMLTASVFFAVLLGILPPLLDVSRADVARALPWSAAGFILHLISFFWWRFRIEARAGKEICLLSIHSTIWNVAGVIAMVLLSTWILSTGLDRYDAVANIVSPVSYSPGAFVAGVLLINPFLYLWWGRAYVSVALHENGVVREGVRFYPWSAVSWAWWNTESGELELKIKQRRIRTRIPPDQRATVQEVLERFEVRELKYY